MVFRNHFLIFVAPNNKNPLAKPIMNSQPTNFIFGKSINYTIQKDVIVCLNKILAKFNQRLTYVNLKTNHFL